MRKSFSKGIVAVLVAAAFLQAASPAVHAAAPAIVAAQGVTVTVTAEQANIRSGPSTADTIIGVVTKGTALTADAKTADGAWYRVNYNSKPAFIFAQLVGTGAAAPVAAAPVAAAPAPVAAAPAPAAGAGQSISVVTPFLNVRAAPSLSAQIVGQLKQNQAVSADARTADGQWLRINFNGKAAFVWSAFTTFGKGAAVAAAPVAGAPAAPAAAAPAPAAGSGTFEVGAHIKEPERLELMRDSGLNWVKYQVVMDGGAPDMSGLIGTIHGAGMKILIGAIGNRGRANDTGYHREFAANLAAIARQGADAIEVWNEPNLDREYGGSNAGQVNPENYVNMLKEAWTAIKAANGGTLVVAAAPAPTGYFGSNCNQAGCNDDVFLTRSAAAGAGSFMDCQGAHFNGSGNNPDMRSGGPTGDHYSWYFWGTLDTSYNAIKRPLCFTEMGYVTPEGLSGPLPGNFGWGQGTTLQNQADWSGRLITLMRSTGKVRLAIFWNWNFRQYGGDDPQAGYSLLRPSGICNTCAAIKAAMGR